MAMKIFWGNYCYCLIRAKTDNGHIHTGTHTHTEAVDRSSNTSETVIPPLLPGDATWVKGEKGGGRYAIELSA